MLGGKSGPSESRFSALIGHKAYDPPPDVQKQELLENLHSSFVVAPCTNRHFVTTKVTYGEPALVLQRGGL